MKQHLSFLVALLLLVTVWATGCGGEPTAIVPHNEPVTVQAQRAETRVVRETMGERTSAPTPAIESRREEATMTPTPATTPTGIEPPAEAREAVRLAREDLAPKLGLALEAIRLVSVEAVEWRDTSLGCPQPGMMYAQVITPGFRVVLESGGKRYDYHTDTGRFVVLCEK